MVVTRLRTSRPGLLAASIVALLALLMPSVALGAWSEKTLRNVPGAELGDADFAGANVAVAWQEAGHVYLRTSTNAGASFSPAVRVADIGGQVKVDICGSDLYLAFVRKAGGTQQVRLAHRTMGAPGFVSRTLVSGGTDPVKNPDVTCAGGRVFVAWQQRVSGTFRLQFDSALRSDDLFGGSPVDVEVSHWFGGGPSLAGEGSSGLAILAYQEGAAFSDGAVWAVRLQVGGAPDYDYLGYSALVVGTSGSNPHVAKNGSKVAVAWTNHCGSLRSRVSNNGGNTYDLAVTLKSRSCDVADVPAAVADSVAIGQQRIIVTYGNPCGGFEEPPCTRERLISTVNDFDTFTNTKLLNEDTYATFAVGFVTVASTRRVAFAEGEASRYIRYRRQE